MKLVYVLGGNYDANGMASIITKKINWYSEHTDWEIIALLTENSKGRPFYYSLHPNVRVINFNLDFDELDTMPKLKKLVLYRRKQKTYKRQFYAFLMSYRPDIVVSAMRREINFLTGIHDGSKKVGELHFCRKTYRVFNHPHLPSFICRCITRYWQNQLIRQIKKLDAFVVLTEEDRKAWTDLPNIYVIPNFISKKQERYSDCLQKTVIAVGRYTEQKGFDLLFQAWKNVEERNSDWTLKIFGAGNHDDYQRLADSMGLQHVQLYGPIKDVSEAFRNASIFAFSSRYEGFGMALIEAMSCGIPSVSFACPCGPRDIICNGEDGFLVEDFDINDFSERLLFLMNDENTRRDMGRKASQNMRRYLEDGIMDKWMNTLLSM